ncbi:uncharacterized protein LOC103723744 [Phoenix dactylifera]|uniref:Uncharacterized protein LOC103723744 n=1 Tax=Phoenix dactylifera TaxID=42345 RepID=A0A8B7D4G3_PHODC|nr:uncharacterized protein LOC103723744 [Phoenix dactylifera]
MASIAGRYWRSVASQARANRWLTTATTPKMKPSAPAAADFVDHNHGAKSRALKGEYAPIYIVLGMMVLALSIGTHTAKQQLMYSPSVRVSKKKREVVAEVEDPDQVTSEANRFISKSFFRKVAHIQDFDSIRSGTPDPTRPNPFNQPRNVETLESVGVNPRGH